MWVPKQVRGTIRLHNINVLLLYLSSFCHLSSLYLRVHMLIQLPAIIAHMLCFWSLLRDRLHALVMRGYCLRCPNRQMNRQAVERDWSQQVRAARSTEYSNMSRGCSPAEEKLRDQLEENMFFFCHVSGSFLNLLFRFTSVRSFLKFRLAGVHQK